MRQDIRFCKSADGARLGYALVGNGPPLVCVPTIHSGLEHGGKLPTWGHAWETLARNHTLVQFDLRGTGYSDRNVPDFSIEQIVADLGAVTKAAGIDRFALFGALTGSASASMIFAARNPERVSHLILLNPVLRGLARSGRTEGAELASATLAAIRKGWGTNDPLFHQLFTRRFFPEATVAQMRDIADFQRLHCTPEVAEQFFKTMQEGDFRDRIEAIRAPTLIFQRRESVYGQIDTGSELLCQIPGSRLVALEGSSVYLLSNEDDVIETFLNEVRQFLGDPGESSWLSRGRRIVRKVSVASHAMIASTPYKTVYGVLALLAALGSVAYYVKALL